jgi:Glycosyl transferase family 2
LVPTAKRDIKVSIVTTVRDPGTPLLSFVRYHLALGVTHIYMFFDDPDDPWLELAERLPAVKAIAYDDALRDWQRRSLPSFERLETFLNCEVMARQILNADTAIQMAFADGAHWLLHLDIDELFYCQGRIQQHFANMPEEVAQVRYPNFEAFPEVTDIDDYFRTVTLFKKNPHFCESARIDRWLTLTGRQWYFVAYRNGKAAVRVMPGVSTSGVHVFDVHETSRQTVSIANPYVLHYPNCGLDYFIRKYRLLGAFSDKAFEQFPRPSCHLESRDVVLRGDMAEIRAFFDQHILCRNAAEADSLLEADLGRRITGPRDFLSDLSTSTHAESL